ncbi:MAG: DUF1003 domain-containing protein [Paracoccaceae bacterium]
MHEPDRDHAERLRQSGRDDLSRREQRVLDRIAKRAAISRDIDAASLRELTFGQRVADKVASFGGSWTFIAIFAGVILAWVFANGVLLTGPPDPFPFILLNLILSMLAAVQAPVIMMSQNRLSANDRLTMTHDYEVNLKAELEIMSLHDKVDDIRMRQLGEHFARIEARMAGIEAALARIGAVPGG